MSEIGRNTRKAICALLLYAALFACLSSMAGLSALGLPALLPGAAVAAALCLLPRPRDRAVLGLAAGAALLWVLLRLSAAASGGAGLLNRLFAASEARERYLYDRLPAGAGTENVPAALLPLGLLCGAGLGASLRRGWTALALLPCAALLCFIAWLGVSPRPIWLAALAVAAVSALRGGEGLGLPAAAAALLAAAVLLVLPGENQNVNAWAGRARDRLAPHTVSYAGEEVRDTEAPAGQKAAGEEKEFRRLEEPAEEDGGAKNLRPLLAGLAILLALLLLFVPAVWRDRLEKRRAALRRGFEDPVPAKGICALFDRALALLGLCGLCLENLPESGYLPRLRAADAALGEDYERVLPLWQEAACSEHPMTEAQRAALHGFYQTALTYVNRALPARQRRLARLRGVLLEGKSCL